MAEDNASDVAKKRFEMLKKSLEIESLELDLEQQRKLHQKPPEQNSVIINSFTEDPVLKKYYDEFSERFLLEGNKFRGPHTSGKYGNGRILVTVGLDGSVLGTRMLQSTGHTELDNYVMDIVKHCSPFSPIPKEVAVEAHRLEIIRSFKFEKSDHW
jgi:TonB family protein